MIQSRRNDVRRIVLVDHATSHAGLWLDKYMDGQLMRGENVAADKATPRATLVSEVARLEEPKLYRDFYACWEQSLRQMGVICRKATVQGRLSVGLGGEGVLETAITLHRTYGVPYIPGSALKGLAANYARNKLDKDDWNTGSDAYRVMFGNTNSAGYVTFFDALYVPDSGHLDRNKHPRPLWPDIITVHHPNYYQGDEPPADWDSPTPVPFVSATGTYLLAIGGPPEWVEKAYEILTLALNEEGIGAKTSSGYGRMSIEGLSDTVKPGQSSTPAKTAVDPEQAIIDQFLLELQNLGPSDAAKFATLAQRWQTLEVSPENKLCIAQALLDKLDKTGRTKKVQDKSWFQQLRSYVEKGGRL